VLFSVASGLCFIRLDAVVSATVRPGGTGIATPTACAPAALRLGHLQTQAPVTDVKPLERREGMLGVLDCPEVEEREAGLAAPDDAEGLDITVADLRLELTHAHPPEVKPYHTVYLIRLEAIGWLGSRVVSMLDSGAEGLGFKSQSTTLSGNSLRQTVHTHRVHQAEKLVAALLTVAGVTAGLAESNGSLPSSL